MKTLIKKYRKFIKFKKQFNYFKENNNNNETMDWSDRWPCYDDSSSGLGYDRHYVYHTAWAARKLAIIKPNYHVDIASLLYFSTIVSAFIPVKFYEYRPPNFDLQDFQADFVDLKNLHFDDNSIKSLSCMHAVEHIGLGRYGDEIDPDGDIIAINELKRVLAYNGDLLFVVPIGKSRIQFNAHRIYSHNKILEYFKDFKLMEFAIVPEDLIINPSEEIINSQTFACGCYWFRKI